MLLQATDAREPLPRLITALREARSFPTLLILCFDLTLEADLCMFVSMGSPVHQANVGFKQIIVDCCSDKHHANVFPFFRPLGNAPGSQVLRLSVPRSRVSFCAFIRGTL